MLFAPRRFRLRVSAAMLVSLPFPTLPHAGIKRNTQNSAKYVISGIRGDNVRRQLAGRACRVVCLDWNSPLVM